MQHLIVIGVISGGMKSTNSHKKKRIEVYHKYNGHCAYCGTKLTVEDMQIDHIVSKNRGGKDEVSNYNPSCRMCNFYKSDNSMESFRKMVGSLIVRLRKIFIFRLAERYGIITINEDFKPVFYYERGAKENDE